MLLKPQQLSRLLDQDLYRLALEGLAESGRVSLLKIESGLLFIFCNESRMLLVVDASSTECNIANITSGQLRTFLHGTEQGVVAQSFAGGKLLAIRLKTSDNNLKIASACCHEVKLEGGLQRRILHLFLTNGRYTTFVGETSNDDKNNNSNYSWKTAGKSTDSPMESSQQLVPSVIPGSTLVSAVSTDKGVFVVGSVSVTSIESLTGDSEEHKILSICALHTAQSGEPELVEPRTVNSCIVDEKLPEITSSENWCFIKFTHKVLCVYACRHEGSFDVRECLLNIPTETLKIFPGLTEKKGDGHLTLVSSGAEFFDLATTGECKRLFTAQYFVKNVEETLFRWMGDILIVAQPTGKNVSILALHGSTGVALDQGDVLQRYSYNYGTDAVHKLCSWGTTTDNDGTDSFGMYWDDCSRLTDAYIIGLSGSLRDVTFPIRLYSSDVFVKGKTLAVPDEGRPLIPFSRSAPLLTLAQRGLRRLRTMAMLEGLISISIDPSPSGLGTLSLRLLRVLFAECRGQKTLTIKESLGAISELCEAIKYTNTELEANNDENAKKVVLSNRQTLSLAVVELLHILLTGVLSILNTFELTKPGVVPSNNNNSLSQEQLLGLSHAVHAGLTEILCVRLLLDGETSSSEGIITSSCAFEANVALINRIVDILEDSMKGCARDIISVISNVRGAALRTETQNETVNQDSEKDNKNNQQVSEKQEQQNLLLEEIKRREPGIIMTSNMENLFSIQPFDHYLDTLSDLSPEEFVLSPPEVFDPLLHIFLPELEAEDVVGSWAESVAKSVKESGLKRVAWLLHSTKHENKDNVKLTTLQSALSTGSSWSYGISQARNTLNETLAVVGYDKEALENFSLNSVRKTGTVWSDKLLDSSALKFPQIEKDYRSKLLRGGELFPFLVRACFYLHTSKVPELVCSMYPLLPFTSQNVSLTTATNSLSLREASELIIQTCFDTCLSLAKKMFDPTDGIILNIDPIRAAIEALGKVALKRVRTNNISADVLLDMTIARLLEMHTVSEGILYLASHNYVSSAVFLSIQLTDIQKTSQTQEHAATTNVSVLTKMFSEKTEMLKKHIANVDYKAHKESLIASGMKETDNDMAMFNYIKLILLDTIKNPDNVMKSFDSEGLGFHQRQFRTTDIAHILQLCLTKRDLLLPDFECVQRYIKSCKMDDIVAFLSHIPSLRVPSGEKGTRALQVGDMF